MFVESVIATGKPWTDPDFPPHISSLFDPENDEGKIETYKLIQWRRVAEIFKKPAIFTDGVTPNDIKQGMLGDCYFLSALSSMAENPENIMERFQTRTINKAGIYMMTFYINGVLTPVIVDDFMPTRAGRLCFASSVDNELWVCLLEKAWAKLYGTYARIEGGDPAFAAVHLEGAPAVTTWHKEIKDKEKFWA